MKEQLRDIAAALMVLQGVKATGKSLVALDALTPEQLLDFVHGMATEVLKEEQG